MENILGLLTACILFVCIEFVRGDHRQGQGLAHITCGILILKSHQQLISTSKSPTVRSIFSQIIGIFGCLSIHPLLKNTNLPLLIYTPDLPHGPFSSLLDARNSLIVIANVALNSTDTARLHSPLRQPGDVYDESEETRATANQTSILTQLAHWKKSLELFTCSDSPNSISSDPKVKRLLVYHLATAIWTRAALGASSGVWDGETLLFREIIELCRSIIDPNPQAFVHGLKTSNTWYNAFSFDIGIVPSLALTATMCRDPALRREAIALLGLVRPRTEGMWDVKDIYKSAMEVMEMEENRI